MTTQLLKSFKVSQAKTLLDEIQFQKTKYYFFLGKINPWGDPDTPPSLNVNRVVDSITIIEPGSGYTTAPAVTISPPDDPAGVQAIAQTNNPQNSGTTISSITILNPGSGYTSVPSVEIASPPTGGVKATAVANITSLEPNSLAREYISDIAIAKRILANETSVVTRRINWVAQKVFDMWDHTIDMEDKDFYCITDEFHVYKCIDNNNGAPSTEKPSETDINIFTTSDGYKWKYMYTVPVIKRTQFLTEDYIPVQTALSDSFYNNGEITALQVVSEGANYTNNSTTTISVNDTGVTTGSGCLIGQVTLAGDGTLDSVEVTNGGSGYTLGANVVIGSYQELTGRQAVGVAVVGKINSTVVITEPGSGYTEAPLVTIAPPDDENGIQAEAVATIDVNGTVDTIIVTEQGSGYTTNPLITISAPVGAGTTATATVTAVETDSVTSIKITDAGAGYTTAPSVQVTVGDAILVPVVADGKIVGVSIESGGAGYVSAPTLSVNGAGTGLYGNSTAILKAHVYEGNVVNVTLEDPGQNYSNNTETEISIAGDGTGATAVAVIENGSIVDTVLTNRGTGYTYAVITVNSTTGVGAKINALIGSSDIESDQSVIEQTAIRGAINAIKVTNIGSGYTSTPLVSIEGNGTGAAATAVLNVDGEVEQILVTSPGSGYTYANVIIGEPGEGGVIATAYAILPPFGGHGSNALTELNANKLMLSAIVSYNSFFDILKEQEYRTYGIIKNPRDIFTNAFVTRNYATSWWTCKFNNVDSLVIDEIVTHSTTLNKFVVAKIITENSGTSSELHKVYLVPIDSDSVPPLGAIESEEINNSTRTYSCEQIIDAPTINKYSGELVMISNENSFEFNENQSVRLQTIIQF